MSLRKLKFHEQKLLKKVDFVQWGNDDTIHRGMVIRRYHLTGHDEYKKYQVVAGRITHLVNKLKELETSDPYRIRMSGLLCQKLYNMGLIHDPNSLLYASRVNVSSFCKRRLPIVMVRLKMSHSISEAHRMISQGHIRVGPNTILDPAFLVTRPLEDFVTWVDGSGIQRTVQKFNNAMDDYDSPAIESDSKKRKKASKQAQQANKAKK